MRKPALLLEGTLIGTPIIAFLILKAYSFHPTLSDDWIYAYLAQRVGEGAWPHRDFFFAHPPVHLLTLVPVLKITGFSIPAVRMVPSVATVLSGLFLWGIVRREGGRIAALGALLLFLFSYDVLRSSSHMTGANLSLAYLSGGAWFLLRGRRVAAGVLLALASLTALYTLPIIAGLLAFTHWRRSPGWHRAPVSFAAVFVGLQILVALPAPGSYVDEVYLYHRGKQANPKRTHTTWTRAGAHHGLMGMGLPVALGGLVVLWGMGAPGRTPGSGARARPKVRAKPQRTGKRRPNDATPPDASLPGAEDSARLRNALATTLALGTILLLFLLTLPEVYTYYLMAPYAILAVCMGLGLAAWMRAARLAFLAVHSGRHRGGGRDDAARRLVPAAAAGLVVLVGGVLVVEIGRPKASEIYPAGRQVHYDWADAAALPAAVNSLVRRVFWDDVRILGRGVSAVTRYLWHETRGLTHVDEVAAEAARRTDREDRLFGDSLLAPLVALTAGRRLAGDEADTNTKRFHSGATDMASFLAAMEEEIGGLVFIERRYVDSFREFRDWKDERFEVSGRWREADGSVVFAPRREGPTRGTSNNVGSGTSM